MKKVLSVICLLLLCLELFVVEKLRMETPAITASRIPQEQTAEVTEPVPEAAPAAPADTTAVQTPAPTPESTPEPTPEPQKEFVITLMGDCTLWSNPNYAEHPAGFKGVMAGDYAYPSHNTLALYADDEFTISNCECTLSDTSLPYDYTQVYFPFLAPTDYAEVFNAAGIDFVTTANNHMMDCYQAGADSTYAALEEHGVPFGREGEGKIIETPHGLRLGVYCSGTDLAPNKSKAVAAIEQLKADGAEYIICALHWGQELYYTPNKSQIDLAHACIDAGADLIYGSHTHCLQPIEEYNGGLILYSCGNWIFGGNTMPSDPDTALFQVTLERAADGYLVRKGSVNVIPCCVSSKIDESKTKAQNYNDYCPTPYETDSEEFNRVFAKLTGEYEPSSQGADYTDWLLSRGG